MKNITHYTKLEITKGTDRSINIKLSIPEKEINPEYDNDYVLAYIASHMRTHLDNLAVSNYAPVFNLTLRAEDGRIYTTGELKDPIVSDSNAKAAIKKAFTQAKRTVRDRYKFGSIKLKI